MIGNTRKRGCVKICLTSSTFWEVLADASKNSSPFSLANCSPSSLLTALLLERSHLFPMSIIVMFGFACWRASSSQLAKWLNVSLLDIKRNSGNDWHNICKNERGRGGGEKKREYSWFIFGQQLEFPKSINALHLKGWKLASDISSVNKKRYFDVFNQISNIDKFQYVSERTLNSQRISIAFKLNNKHTLICMQVLYPNG